MKKDTYGQPCRIILPDDTSWANPLYRGEESTGARRDAALGSDYYDLLMHPWGTEVSVKKLRWLRRELKRLRQEAK